MEYVPHASARLRERVALITGAARRVGAVIAETLHGEGMNLVLHYRHSEAEAQALCARLNERRSGSAIALACDLHDMEALPRLVEAATRQWNRLDVLVNNASTFYPTPVGTITEDHWNDLLGSNLKAPLFLSQAAAEPLRVHGGCIVNITDIHAHRPLKSHPVYSIAKAGLVMLTRSLARELGPEIRVNGVAPGAILWPEMEVDEIMKQRIIARTALKRQGSPVDVARAVLFLAGDADYISGEIITVDGGRLLGD
ncbi:MAG TPA: pteridine reductase [Gammaproteobacteria bacterium]|nr:pteridine reductase [Gammaproteobacteria bacterium]